MRTALPRLWYFPAILIILIVMVICSRYAGAQEQHRQGLQMDCGPLFDVLREANKFGEKARFVATLEVNGGTVRIPVIGFANPKTGTFTIIMRSGRGEACVVLDGTGYDEVDVDADPPGDPS